MSVDRQVAVQSPSPLARPFSEHAQRPWYKKALKRDTYDLRDERAAVDSADALRPRPLIYFRCPLLAAATHRMASLESAPMAVDATTGAPEGSTSAAAPMAVDSIASAVRATPTTPAAAAATDNDNGAPSSAAPMAVDGGVNTVEPAAAAAPAMTKTAAKKARRARAGKDNPAETPATTGSGASVAAPMAVDGNADVAAAPTKTTKAGKKAEKKARAKKESTQVAVENMTFASYVTQPRPACA